MKVFIVLLIALFSYLQYKLWIAEGKVQDSWQLELRINKLQNSNGLLRQRNNALQAEVTNLKSGHEVIEEKARSELGFVGKDETFFQYIETDDASNN